MRVLAMFHAYVPVHGAGAETTAHALLRHLVAHGHQVDVIVSKVDAGIPGDYEVDGITVHAHQGKAQAPLWLNSTATRPDVIVCHLENTARAAVLGQMYSIPVVQLLHNDMPETRRSTLRFPFALLVCNSDWLAASYRDFWMASEVEPPAPVIRVHPVVRPAAYRTTPGKNVTLVNLTVGKGAAVLYALAQQLPQYSFLGVVGAYGVQVRRSDLPNVEIIDHVSTDAMVEQVYARTKVVLMPSDYESYGRVGVEAMCSGIPVIAHPTSGLREALGDAGLFHDRNELPAWVAELRRLHSPRGWSTSSQAALRWVSTLDPDAELTRWRTAIEEVGRAPAATRLAG
jgi:glycosyltransferase involved in cell wall biosynthesis